LAGIDSQQKRVFGYRKHGAAFGYAKIGGKSLLVRRQLRQPGNADPAQVGLETGQVMPVAHDRLRAQATLGGQVLEEPRHRPGEGQITARPATALETGQHHRQHLLDRAADLPSRLLATAERGHPHRDETIDMSGQVRRHQGAAHPGELPERHQHRDPAQHRPGAIPLLRQAAGIALDLRADPARPDPVDRLGLDEVGLQHRDNFLSILGDRGSSLSQGKHYVAVRGSTQPLITGNKERQPPLAT